MNRLKGAVGDSIQKGEYRAHRVVKSSMEIGSAEWKKVIRDGAAELGIEVSAEQAGLFGVHAREMMIWNRRINLTAVTDPADMAVKHYVDSIAAVPFINPDASLLDVGSGAGFPGIPLKIMLPPLKATLLETRRKRVNFLKHSLRSLDIADVGVLQERLEKMPGLLPTGSGFDVIVSRAFSDLETFVSHSLALLNPGGWLVAYKGMRGDTLDSEVAGLEKRIVASDGGKKPGQETGLRIDVRSFVLPRMGTERTLIMITRSER